MSAIDTTVPVYGNPTTASVRQNFAIAAAELDEKLPLMGGTMTGPILLARDAINPLEPVTLRQIQNIDAALPFVPLDGSQPMTGPLTLSGPPTATLHATTKNYVDAADALALPLAGGTMTGPLTLSGPPTVALHPATKAYVDAVSSSLANYLPLTGGALSGGISFGSNIDSAPSNAAKHIWLYGTQYGIGITGSRLNLISQAGSNVVDVIGGVDTFTVGASQITAAVNAVFNGTGPGLAVTNNLTVGGNSTFGTGQANQVQITGGATNCYMTIVGSGTNGAWVLQAQGNGACNLRNTTGGIMGSFADQSGGTIGNGLTVSANNASGPVFFDTTVVAQGYRFRSAAAFTQAVSMVAATATLTLFADPVAALQAATKQYVDAGDAKAVPLAGGTMTGLLNLSADPTANLGAATKQYVDGRIQTPPPPSSTVPIMDSVGAVGTSTNYARADHVHPSDTSRLSTAGGTLTGNLTVGGNGVGYSTFGTHGFGFDWNGTRVVAHVDGTASPGALANYGDLAAYLPLAGGTVTGALTVNGALTLQSNLQVNSGLMVVNGIMYVANNTAYYMGRNGSNGTWGFVDNNAYLFYVTNGGAANCSGQLSCYNDASYGLYISGGARLIGWASGQYIGWNASTTDTNLVLNNAVQFANRWSDGLCWAARGPGGGNGAYANVSDASAKANIEDAPHGLAHVLRLQPKTFTRTTAAVKDRVELGFVSQDVEGVIPEAVVPMHDPADARKAPMLGLQSEAILAAAVNAIKELSARIVALESRTIH